MFFKSYFPVKSGSLPPLWDNLKVHWSINTSTQPVADVLVTQLSADTAWA